MAYCEDQSLSTVLEKGGPLNIPFKGVRKSGLRGATNIKLYYDSNGIKGMVSITPASSKIVFGKEEGDSAIIPINGTIVGIHGKADPDVRIYQLGFIVNELF